MHVDLIIVFAVVGGVTAILGPIIALTVWAIRLEGELKAAKEKIKDNKETADKDLVALADRFGEAVRAVNDRLSDAITALAKFDENTQDEVKGYRLHTEAKIEALSKDISAKFERVFDKLDEKADKA